MKKIFLIVISFIILVASNNLYAKTATEYTNDVAKDCVPYLGLAEALYSNDDAEIVKEGVLELATMTLKEATKVGVAPLICAAGLYEAGMWIKADTIDNITTYSNYSYTIAIEGIIKMKKREGLLRKLGNHIQNNQSNNIQILYDTRCNKITGLLLNDYKNYALGYKKLKANKSYIDDLNKDLTEIKKIACEKPNTTYNKQKLTKQELLDIYNLPSETLRVWYLDKNYKQKNLMVITKKWILDLANKAK
ncbi:MAG: hypothetical protein HHAS10_12010 [Candidatus Altimarinota bacterium]